MSKSQQAFRTISEVSSELDVPAHVLRFWETKFPQIKPMKRGGGRRYYRPEDIALLKGVREMLHVDGYSIKGVQKALREQGVRAVSERTASGGASVTPLEEAAAAPAAKAATAPAGKGREAELRAILETLVALRAELTGETGARRKSA